MNVLNMTLTLLILGVASLFAMAGFLLGLLVAVLEMT